MALPNVSSALRGWTKKTPCKRVTKTIINFKQTETVSNVILDMMITPMQPEKIQRKPEEQRSWRWYQAHIRSKEQQLNFDDKIIMATGKTYRIEAVGPWGDAGFYYYEMVEDYQ